MKVKVSNNHSVQSASMKVATAAGVGLIGALLVGILAGWKYAPLALWDIGAGIYLVTTWREVLAYDGHTTKQHALREDPSRWLADIILIGASVVSLAAVGLVLSGSRGDSSSNSVVAPALSVLSVIISWLMVHTVYALRYAEMYYSAPQGGVDFGETTDPKYIDFAYLAFTMGMTYQVSDTTLKTQAFRTVVLKQALLAYFFGTVIVATVINLVAGLGQ